MYFFTTFHVSLFSLAFGALSLDSDLLVDVSDRFAGEAALTLRNGTRVKCCCTDENISCIFKRLSSPSGAWNSFGFVNPDGCGALVGSGWHSHLKVKGKRCMVPVSVADDFKARLPEDTSYKSRVGECPCELQFRDDAGSSIMDYLEHFAKNNMEKCCPNHGRHFGSWGKACPDSFEEIYTQVKQGMVAADGGKSGQQVLIGKKFVIKEAAGFEADTLPRFLEEISKRNGSDESLIAPICRVISLTRESGSRKVTISLNMRIQNSHMFPESLFFDLKGNYGNAARITGTRGNTKKDGDFWMRFPSGVHITGASLLEMEERIAKDTEMLSKLGHTDYSLLLHMVEWCESPIQGCAAQYNVDRPSGLHKFRRTCVRLAPWHMGRPVYVNDEKEFMYFHGAWRIGRDIHSNDNDKTLFAEGDSSCPDSSVAWGIRAGEKYSEVPVHVQSDDIQLDFQSKDAMKQANPHVPLAFATASTEGGIKTYVVAYALADVFLSEKRKGPLHKHYGNELKAFFSGATCRQNDLSQLDSSPFRARFLMMWNHRIPDEPCLAKHAYFTYFTRTEKLLAVYYCPEGETTACKSLCKHLGLAEPSETNGQCDAVNKMFDPCKNFSPYYEPLVGKWGSSQDQILDLLRKDVWDSQVMYFVNKIKEEMAVMDDEKQEKYASCHKKLKQALEDFTNKQSCTIDDEGNNQLCQ